MSDIRLVIDSYGYDGVVSMELWCVTCGEGLSWPGAQSLDQPIDGWSAGDLVAVAKVLAELTEAHGPNCTPKPPPSPPPVMVKPVITPDPEPVLGERTIKLGGQP